MKSKKSVIQTVTEFATPLAEELGYIIWDIEYVKEGGKMILRFTIDKEGGVGIEDCEKFHRAVDLLIEEADPIEDTYTLEVSSPGIERELKYNWHFDVCIGQTVQIKLYKPLEGQKTFVGMLVSYGDTAVIDCAGKTIEIPAVEIAKANIYFDFTNI